MALWCSLVVVTTGFATFAGASKVPVYERTAEREYLSSGGWYHVRVTFTSAVVAEDRPPYVARLVGTTVHVVTNHYCVTVEYLARPSHTSLYDVRIRWGDSTGVLQAVDPTNPSIFCHDFAAQLGPYAISVEVMARPASCGSDYWCGYGFEFQDDYPVLHVGDPMDPVLEECYLVSKYGVRPYLGAAAADVLDSTCGMVERREECDLLVWGLDVTCEDARARPTQPLTWRV